MAPLSWVSRVVLRALDAAPLAVECTMAPRIRRFPLPSAPTRCRAACVIRSRRTDEAPEGDGQVAGEQVSQKAAQAKEQDC
jgi:hypothetical protein